MDRNKKKLWLERAVSVAAALLLWHAAAGAVGQRLLLPSPADVLIRLGGLFLEEGFLASAAFSFVRIVSGFLLGLALGSLFAATAAFSRLAEVFFWPYLTAIKSVPVASFIIICLIWLDASGLSVFISFLMVFPVVYFNVLEGMKSADRKLLQMADLFHMSRRKKLFYIYLPQTEPFLLSACSTALGVSWKAGIAAEVIGIPDGSIGERLYEAKIYLNTAELLAWTVVIVILSVLFEKLFMKALRTVLAALKRR